MNSSLIWNDYSSYCKNFLYYYKFLFVLSLLCEPFLGLGFFVCDWWDGGFLPYEMLCYPITDWLSINLLSLIDSVYISYRP